MHGLTGNLATRHERHCAGDAMRAFADARGRHKQREVTAQQRASEQPAPSRQHRDVEAVKESGLQRRRTDNRLLVDGDGRIRHVPFRPPPGDHGPHILTRLFRGITGKRHRLGGGGDLRVAPAPADPVTDKPQHIVVPMISRADASDASIDREGRCADVQVKGRR